MKFQKHSHTPPLEASEAAAWFAGRLPADWFTAAPEVSTDSEEILVVGTLGDVDLPETATDAERATARTARITGFRQDTRERRVRIALEAEHRFGRKVSWGAVCGDRRELFTTLSVPFMTRLRMPERAVLDTLVEAGVARSRSEALAWCVRLVGNNQAEWIQSLREALGAVGKARAEGPEA
ncbi:MAG TPA: hypothetical protein VMU20_17985 [Candidatus Dormibacteraeota bacterium]|nr:hypothetical protein [Candidatus Dormibacteraeota bacterium]